MVMKKFIFILLFNFLFVHSQDFQWYLKPNDGGSSIANHSITGPNNEVYFSGTFVNSIGFKRDNTFQLIGGTENRSFVAKLDQNGNYLWSRKIDGDDIRITSLNSDSGGNLIITGTADGNRIDLNTDDPGEEIISAGNGNDLRGTFIIKLNSAGQYIWGNFYQETWSEGYSEVDKQNNILTFGQFTSATDFDASVVGTYKISVPEVSNFIMKTDADGKLIWVKYFTRFWKLGMKVDDDGNVICAGNFNSQLNFNGEKDFNLPSSYDHKSFIMKLDSGGNFTWYQPLINEFRANSVNQTLGTYSNGDIVILADFQNATNITFPNRSVLISGGYSLSSFLLNIDKNGNYLNHSVIKSTDNLYSYNLMVDSKGDQRIFVNPSNKIVDVVTAMNVLEKTKLIAKNNSIMLKFSRTGSLIYHKSGLFTRYNTTFAMDNLDAMYLPGYLITAGKLDLNPSQDASLTIQSGFFNSISYLQKLSGCYTQVPDGDQIIIGCSAQNIRLSDLFPKTSYTKWYTTETGTTTVPSNTLFQNGISYYASVPDSSCPNNPTRLKAVASISTNLPALVVSDFTICNAETYQLSSLNIDESKGPLKFFNKNGNQISESTAVVPEEQYFVSYFAGGCNSEKAPFKVFNKSTIPAGSSLQTFCKSSAPTLTDLDVSGQKLIFYDGNGTVLNPQTVLQDQNFYYVTQTVNLCTSLKLKIQVLLKETAVPAGNAVQNFCIQSKKKISDIQISGTAIKWFDATGIVLDATTPLINGTKYYATQTLNGCESAKKEITVTINDPNPPTGNTVQDFCSAQLPEISDIVVSGQNIKWFDATGNILSTTTPLIDGKTYFATQTINGCESTQKLAITVSIKNGGIVAKDYSVPICNSTINDTKIENLNTYKKELISAPANYTFTFFAANNQVISDPTNVTLTLGLNVFSVKISNSLGCFVVVQLNLTLSPKPKLNVPENVEFCNGQSITLDAGGGGLIAYEWTRTDDPKVISNKQILVVSTPGNYILKVENGVGCQNSAIIKVTQSVLANITGILIVNNTATVQMSETGDFEYSLDQVKWQKSNVFEDLKNGNYTASVRTKSLCILGSLDFSIFSVSNIFTPNSDGQNDQWIISGLENYPNSEVKVYDRSGKIVFEKVTNGVFGWDGTSNSRVLPTGNYWYFIKVSDGRLLQGWLLLKNRN
jgi:gliding motility-associated-like protein